MISFPIGGIGTGSIGLAGNGQLIDWEIYNRPFKGSANGFTHLMVKAESKGKVRDVRVLQGDFAGHGMGGETVNIKRGNGGFGYGFGPYRGTMAGVPHFQHTVFEGEFPFARIRFQDPYFPGKVELTAFNPFIPLEDDDSSLPVAIFEIGFRNDTDETLDYSALYSLNNILPYASTENIFFREKNFSGIRMTSNRTSETDLHYGNMCIMTDAENVSCQQYWYRAEWFDSLQTFWNDVNRHGKLKNRIYENDHRKPNEKLDWDGDDMGTLGAHVTVRPGENASVRFVLGWFFPNCENYWNPEKDQTVQRQWKNYYATIFSSSWHCAQYTLENYERLYQGTLRFQQALMRTSLPAECMEAVSANLSILKSATVMRLEDGSFYGFEGCCVDSGCCEGSCSHVWNYAYALPYLFPRLERSMRDLEYRYSQREDGSVSFRLQLPLGRHRYDFRACVDGQMGGVMKVYRDFKLCGDLDWLRGKWEAVQKSIEFAWADSNEDKWDYDQDGVMEGRQHHTLDMELFGPSAWLNGFYQGALKAAAEIAVLLGHADEAARYEKLYQNGKKWVDEHLFNGEYYQQQIDLKDRSLLERYNDGKPLVGADSLDAYWNDEIGEIKYQIASGSSVDQVIGQWHANLSGLGEIFDHQQVISALQSIYRYNYKRSSRNEFNAARIYCYNDEGGVRVCAWPVGKKQPGIPITYSNEVMCGMEYQVASHMIQEGLLEEGFEIVHAIRARFDGENRNPWNEFECGSNYARSMASFALVPSISGYVCDLFQHSFRFAPKSEGDFSAFWSNGDGWGEYQLNDGNSRLCVLYGKAVLRELKVPMLSGTPEVKKNESTIVCRVYNDVLQMNEEVTLQAGDELTVCFKKEKSKEFPHELEK